MRADRAITQSQLDFGSYYEKVNADYINQLRVERLMAKANRFYDRAALYREMRSQCRYDELYLAEEYYQKSRKCRLIAFAYESRAKRIKKGM